MACTVAATSLFLASSMAQAEEINYVGNLIKIRDQLPYLISCHQLGVKYQQGFPAEINTVKGDGWLTSSDYKKQEFINVAYQTYGDGQKRYYLPVDFGDYSGDPKNGGEEFSDEDDTFHGFISYKVKKVVEPYNPAKHDIVRPHFVQFFKYDFKPKPRVHYGDDLVRPVLARYTNNVKILDSVSNIPFPGGPMFIYEVCFDPQFHLATGEVQAPLTGFPVGAPGVRQFGYAFNDVPTYIAYGDFYRQTLDEHFQQLDAIEFGIRIVAAATPVVGTTLSIIECKSSGDPYCWAQAAADAAGDAAQILTLGGGTLVKLGRLAKMKNVVRAGNAIRKSKLGMIEYFGIAANIGIGMSKLQRDEYLDSIGNWVAAGSDILFLRLGKGRIKSGKLSKPKDTCGGPDVSTKKKSVASETPKWHSIDQLPIYSGAEDPKESTEWLLARLLEDDPEFATLIHSARGNELSRTTKVKIDQQLYLVPAKALEVRTPSEIFQDSIRNGLEAIYWPKGRTLDGQASMDVMGFYSPRQLDHPKLRRLMQYETAMRYEETCHHLQALNNHQPTNGLYASYLADTGKAFNGEVDWIGHFLEHGGDVTLLHEMDVWSGEFAYADRKYFREWLVAKGHIE